MWGIDAKNEVYFREGTFGDPEDCDGKEWLKVKKNVFLFLLGKKGFKSLRGVSTPLHHPWMYMNFFD